MESAGGGVIGEEGGATTVTVQEGVPGSPPPKEDVPWSRCIMGCVPSRVRGEEGSGRELVMMLPCLHMLCSKTCVVKLLAEQKDEAGGAHIRCSKCQFRVTREQLSNWMNLEREFSGGSPNQKEAELLCDKCIFDKVATAYCPECPVTLCQSCALLHPQERATQKHVIKHDLSELKKSPSTCQMHRGERLTHACLTCKKKICGDCQKGHDKIHKVTLVQVEKQQLLEKIHLAKQVKDKFEAAGTELGKKREDLYSHQWNKLMNEINDQFKEMKRILTEREKEIKTEAKRLFSTESQALDFKRQDIENAKSSTEQFIKTGEILLNDKDDLASINYLRRTESYIQWLTEMEGTSIDAFAGKDFHVELDTSANIQVLKAIQGYCKVRYHEGQQSEPRLVRTEILTTARAESPRSENAPMDVEETGLARCNGEAGTVTVSDDGREVQNLISSWPDVQTAATPTEMTSASSSPTTTLSSESVTNETLQPFPSTAAASTVQETGMTGGTDSHSQLNARNGVTPSKSALALDMEASTEMFEGASNIPEDEPATHPETVKGARGKRQRKKASHPDFLDWSDIQLNNNDPVNQQSGHGSRHKRRTLSGRLEIGAPESILQPLVPEAPDNHTSGNRKRQRRAKRKYTADGDCDGGTQSTFEASYMKEVLEEEGGSGYISEPNVNGGAIITRRRSIRVRRRSQPGGGDDHHDRDSEMLRLESLDGASSSSAPSLERRHQGRSVADETSAAFPEAPISSIERDPITTHVPILNPDKIRGADGDRNDDFCFICLYGGEILCCDGCSKVFHLGCHIPALDSVPRESTWQCNSHTTKRDLDENIVNYPDSSENAAITEANKRHFVIACKFLMECYKIPEIPTMRWRFPQGYLMAYGKVPYNLQYIKDRLSLADPEPFGSVEEMLKAFKQMFTQAFVYLEEYDAEHVHYAQTYFSNVLNLVSEYYPSYEDLFKP